MTADGLGLGEENWGDGGALAGGDNAVPPTSARPVAEGEAVTRPARPRPGAPTRRGAIIASHDLPRLRNPMGIGWERPKPMQTPHCEDPRELVLLLRQATDSMEWALVRQLVPILGEELGAPNARTLDDVHLLRWIAERPSVATDLAELIGRRVSTVCHRLNRLYAQELIQRKAYVLDARAFTVTLTPKGAKLVEQINAIFDELAHLWCEDIAEDSGMTMSQLGRVLGRMAQAF